MRLVSYTASCLLALASVSSASEPGRKYLWGRDQMGKMVRRQASSTTSAAAGHTTLVADSACSNGPYTRSCWKDGYSIATEYVPSIIPHDTFANHTLVSTRNFPAQETLSVTILRLPTRHAILMEPLNNNASLSMVNYLDLLYEPPGETLSQSLSPILCKTMAHLCTGTVSDSSTLLAWMA